MHSTFWDGVGLERCLGQRVTTQLKTMDVPSNQEAQRILEAALLCAHQPMSLRDLRQLFDGALSTDALLSVLGLVQAAWRGRGIELVEVASGWRFQTCGDVQAHLDRLHPEKPPKYSRAVLETLAIIAYKQPVTRGDIEDIRGVTVSAQIIKQLEDRGWIEVIGHREAPGRPALFATTRTFLDDLGLSSLAQLPTLEGLPLGQASLPGLDEAVPTDGPPADAYLSDALPDGALPTDDPAGHPPGLTEEHTSAESAPTAP